VDIVSVPYPGGAPASIDVMAGRVGIMVDTIGAQQENIKAGKLRALAVTSDKRVSALPDVPTLAESGITGAESGSWVALLAPAGTPQALVDKIAADVKEVVANPEVRAQLVQQGGTPQATTPAQLQALIDADRARYGKVIREKGVKVE
jgi:tripartite-type tricarboxylate transporter receptor subunit TctC